MTDQEKLKQLLDTMGRLCALRATRVHTAEQAIKHANIEFDRDAIPLGRRINALQEKLARERPLPQQTDTPIARSSDNGYDPEWSQEDIDHYLELKRAASGK